MDLTDSIAPKSDQLNADDLISGPRTFTILDVRPGNDEQPVNVYLAEFPDKRPWKPSKSMRRVLVAGWGADTTAYAGRRLTLFRNPDITFGKDKVGGIQVSAMSHLAKPLVFALTMRRGVRAPYTVQPLPESAPTSPALDELTVARLADLRAEYADATPERQAEIKAEAKKLQGGQS